MRAHYLGILREIATNYDVDGLELDWMRFCRHCPAGHQREHVGDLTHFVHDVHIMLREVARQKGRERLILAHRVAPTVDECLNIGCDVETWAKRGYADYLAPMEFFLHDLAVRLDDFLKVIAGTGCLVYPGFGQPRYSYAEKYPLYMRSLDEFRALSCNIYAWGGAGASVFSMYLWKDEDQQFSSETIAILSDPKRALAGPRHYVYLPHAAGAGPTGKVNDQSITIGEVGRRQAFTFRMADGRNGERLRGVLRFRIYDATAPDESAIDLDGEAIAPDKLRIAHQPQGETVEALAGPLFKPGVPYSWPAGLCFEVALEDCPAFRGDNELGVTLTKRDTAADRSLALEAVDVRVTA